MQIEAYKKTSDPVRVAYLQGVILGNGEFVSEGKSFFVTEMDDADEKHVKAKHLFTEVKSSDDAGASGRVV